MVIIAPDCSQDESGLPCSNIDSALDSLSSGTLLQLEPGIHVIEASHLNDTQSFSNISIIGSGISDTIVTCRNETGLAFIGIENLVLMNFTIANCGLTGSNLDIPLVLLEEVIDLWVIVPRSMRVAVLIGDCTDVNIQNVHITNTTGMGLLGINLLGVSVLDGVNFTRNIRPGCSSDVLVPSPFLIQETANQIGGGAYFLYSDYLNTLEPVQKSFLYVRQSYFGHNADCTYAASINMNFPFIINGSQSLYQYRVGGGGGLSIVISNSNYTVNVLVDETEFYQNDARYGGGAYVATFAGVQSFPVVKFLNCIFLENGAADSDVLDKTYTKGGAGMAIFTDLIRPEHFATPVQSADYRVILSVIGTEFIGNQAKVQGGGILAYSFFNTPLQNHTLNPSIIWLFKDTTFTQNFARYSSAVYATQLGSSGDGSSVVVIFDNLNVTNNFNHSTEGILLSNNKDASTVHINRVECIISGTENVFRNNEGSALRIESTIIAIFYNSSVTFQDNIAHRGGAIYFNGESPGLALSPLSSLSFVNNKAIIEGGAIYYASPPTPLEILRPLNTLDCFFIPFDLSIFFQTSSKLGGKNVFFTSNISISFSNNTAPLGGTVFGASLERCPWALDIEYENGQLFPSLQQDYSPTFSFERDPIGREVVSTRPDSVSVRLLSNNSEPIEIFPGQPVDIEIKVYDEYGIEIPTVVTSAVVDNKVIEAQSTLGDSGFWYTSMNQSELKVSGTHKGLLYVSIFTETNSLSASFPVYLSSCPIGFTIDETKNCVCDELILSTSNLQCSSDLVTFNAFENFWVGTDPNIVNPNSSNLIVHSCVFNYCIKLGINTITPPYFDSQCDLNRTGILCGGCKDGYSNVFGTNECVKCNNYWLFLIPAFAIAGAVFFAGIAVLQITIDKGLTNAALFFISIVSFFDFLLPNPAYVYIFLPIRLLSLQIGVTTCFYNGMTALHRSLIQFAFPVYLYALMAVFTLLCRRSSWMSVHFSPAKTLATLMVLCHLNILVTCVGILIPTPVSTITGESFYAWLINPNQRYFAGLHGAMGTLAIALTIIYIIPVPLVLLFPSLAYKYMVRFSPFFDIVWAAYKPKLRFWMGIRVLLITNLFLISHAPSPYSHIFSGILVLIFSHTQAAIRPFKDTWANYADAALITIAILFFWSAQAISQSDYTYTLNIAADIYISLLALAGYIVFFLLLALHIHRQFPSLWPSIRTKLDIKTRREDRRKNLEMAMANVNAMADMSMSQEQIDGDSMVPCNIATSSSVHVPHNKPPSPTRLPRKAEVPRFRESIFETHEIKVT